MLRAEFFFAVTMFAVTVPSFWVGLTHYPRQTKGRLIGILPPVATAFLLEYINWNMPHTWSNKLFAAEMLGAGLALLALRFLLKRV